MSNASSISAEAVTPDGGSRIGRHGYVLAVLATVAIGLSLLIWFHPTFGYADPGSVIAGADLRADLIRLVWWLVAAFAAGSTLVLALVPVRVRAVARYLAAYGSGAALAAIAARVFDMLY